jgi:hypothetical protein
MALNRYTDFVVQEFNGQAVEDSGPPAGAVPAASTAAPAASAAATKDTAKAPKKADKPAAKSDKPAAAAAAAPAPSN